MQKSDLSKYNNSWYYPGSSSITRVLWYYTNVLLFKNGWNPSSELKVIVLRLFGAKVGRGVMIKPGVNIKYPWLLTIGNYCWIGEGVWIDNLAAVILEDNVCLSQGSMVLTGNHDYKKQTFDLKVSQILLEEGAWIGAKAIICPGVTVRSHAILAVGSVATTDLESYQVYQGNPAVFTRQRIIQ